MTNDHVLDERPFTYPGAGSAAAALADVRQQLQELGARADAKPEKWTLYPLVLSFRALASLLRRHRVSGHELGRPGEQQPEFAGRTALEQFPFAHTTPFLDLSGQSQKDVLATLEAVSDELVTSRVHEVRNENLHHRQGENSYKKLFNALTLTASAIRRLEEAGFIRTLYSRDRLEGDRWGRTTHYLRSRSGREVGFRRPASYSWLGMPSLRANQYVMHAARFAEPSEMLRFKVHEDSEFRRLWEGVPHRTRRAIDLSAEEPDIRTSHFETDARAGSGTSGAGPS